MGLGKEVRIRTILAAGACLAAALALGGGASAASKAGGACDKACLTALTDKYLEALLAHQPGRVPAASTVKFTENSIRLKLGDGLWQTVDGVKPFNLTVADDKTGEAASFRIVTENGTPAMLAYRLRAQGGKITEIETFVVRKLSGIHGNFETVPDLNPAWGETLPASARPSRAELIKVANAYFDGIEQANGDIVPFIDETDRLENLTKTSPGMRNGKMTTARESFNSKVFNYIKKVDGRRFLVIDEARGIIVANYMFQHPGNIRQVTGPDNKTIQITGPLASYPNTTSGLEAFRVKNGKLDHILSYVVLNAYRQPSGWEAVKK